MGSRSDVVPSPTWSCLRHQQFLLAFPQQGAGAGARGALAGLSKDLCTVLVSTGHFPPRGGAVLGPGGRGSVAGIQAGTQPPVPSESPVFPEPLEEVGMALECRAAVPTWVTVPQKVLGGV